MTKFTEGPWYLVINANNVAYVTSSASNQADICDLYNKISDHECVLKENAEANGDLISAAPELYNALSAFVRNRQHIAHTVDDHFSGLLDKLFEASEHVLKKARGES